MFLVRIALFLLANEDEPCFPRPPLLTWIKYFPSICRVLRYAVLALLVGIL